MTMAKERKAIDITHTPSVLRLAEEVARTGVPHVLRRNNQDLAVISPATTGSKQARRIKPASNDDPLGRIIGLADASDFPDVPKDVSSDTHRYLAEAYDDEP